MSLHALDVEHLGHPGAICVYVLTEPEPVLVDPGPATTLPTLKRKLAELGLRPTDLRRIHLTHIHLDHAGASGHLVRENPDLEVVVHRDGAPHLVDPERLVASTRRTFGEAHDRLWGEMWPVPATNVRAWDPAKGDAVIGSLRPMPSPGHIAHHLAWLHEPEGVLLTGDSMGIVLHPDGPTHPATPPPSLDLEAWYRTLEGWAGLEVERFGPTHFGLHARFQERRMELLEALRALESRVADALARGQEAVDADAFGRESWTRLTPYLGEARAVRYFETFSGVADWNGVAFYLRRRDRR